MWNKLYKDNKIDLWIDLSTYCNAACPECHRTDARTAGKVDWLPLIQWSVQEFKDAFPTLTLKHARKLQLCGTWGDPMMNKDIYEITDYIINNSKCQIVFNTNGSMRDPLWWWQLGFLVKNRARTYFCIDGINQEMHERYRQKTDLQLVLENMEAYSEFSTACAFTIVFKHNEDYLKKIYNLAKKHGASDHSFVPSDRAHHTEVFKYYDPEKKKRTLEHSPKYGRQPQRSHFKINDI